ncbi:vomeronasal type-2 receptor 26-like [Mantella aurantiaca]
MWYKSHCNRSGVNSQVTPPFVTPHWRPPGVNFDEYKNILALIFAVNEINQDPVILPNVTLGYHIFNTCGDPKKSLGYALQIFSGGKTMTPNYSCRKHDEVVGFIGDSCLSTTETLAKLLSVYRYTQISPRVTDILLSDKKMYPTLYRLSQDDYFRYEAIIKTLVYFEINWVVMVTLGDLSSDVELEELSKMLTQHEICIEHVIRLSPESLDTVMDVLHSSTSNVLILCGLFSPLYLEFLGKLHTVRENIILIAHDSWLQLKFSIHYPMKTTWKSFSGSLIFARRPLEPPGLQSFINGVSLYTRPDDPVLEDIWISYFNCLTANKFKNKIVQILGEFSGINCTKIPHEWLNIVGIREDIHSYVFLAVNVFADALHDMYTTESKSKTSGSMIMTLLSRCNDRCLPGFRKMPSESIHVCCYNCVPCSEGEVSNVTDGETCFKCPDEEWPDNEKVKCISKTYEFLSYENDVIVLIISLAASTFAVITLIILKQFINYKDTPIVKANNQTVSFILLISILLSFLCVFLFLGRPVDITCKLRQISFGIFFSIAVSSVLAKTVTVCIAFKATKPDSFWKKWVSTKVSNSLVFTCSSVQVLICVIWLSVSPPYQEYDMYSYPGKIIIQCNEGSVIGFYIVLGYMGFLAAVSFVLAFMVRRLPDIYNEAKYITFSMLVFCSVWIAMIPAYLSTRGKYMVAVEVFAILASSAGILGCIFFPKCYIINFKPEMNIRKKQVAENKFSLKE